MSKTLTRILAMLQGILLLTAAALFTVNLCCFQRSFYEKEYAKLDTAAEMGMEHADLMEATDALLDYLKGYRINLDLRTTVHGKTVEMFDAREKAHMFDVRALYHRAMAVGWLSLGLALMLNSLLYFKGDRKTALQGMLWGFGIFGAMLAAAAVWAAIDFYSFWRCFHKLLFSNDLWELYPDERLIQMVPEQFFSDLVTRIVAVFAAIAAVLTGGNLLLQRRHKKKSLPLGGEGGTAKP